MYLALAHFKIDMVVGNNAGPSFANAAHLDGKGSCALLGLGYNSTFLHSLSSCIALFRPWFIRNAIGGGRRRTTHKTYQCNQREQIGQGRQQIGQIWRVAQILQGDAQSVAQAEYEAS